MLSVWQARMPAVLSLSKTFFVKVLLASKINGIINFDD
jgi:hypothetical protein